MLTIPATDIIRLMIHAAHLNDFTRLYKLLITIIIKNIVQEIGDLVRTTLRAGFVEPFVHVKKCGLGTSLRILSVVKVKIKKQPKLVFAGITDTLTCPLTTLLPVD